MDELDQLLTAKQDVVYNFFNWPTMRDSQMFVIAVANRMDLPQHLAAKIKSRLGERGVASAGDMHCGRVVMWSCGCVIVES
jgi:Cdc6-like AAA superfamily ATPase